MSDDKTKRPEGDISATTELIEGFKAWCAHMDKTVHEPRKRAEAEERHRRDLASGAAREDLHFK
jgi:hypothetical protein